MAYSADLRFDLGDGVGDSRRIDGLDVSLEPFPEEAFDLVLHEPARAGLQEVIVDGDDSAGSDRTCHGAAGVAAPYLWLERACRYHHPGGPKLLRGRPANAGKTLIGRQITDQRPALGISGSSLPESARLTLPVRWGTPTLGGPIVTAGGLVFIAATLDRTIRAFDVSAGTELWHALLPASATATPMTYEIDGRQYVVSLAGGNPRAGAKPSDAIVAFALPR
jgi:hypothetical protein